MRLTGMIVIWTVGGLATGACDKSDSTGPAPATAQLSRDEPGKLASPKLPSAANRDPAMKARAAARSIAWRPSNRRCR